MTNGCPKCEKIARKAKRRGWKGIFLCLTHQLEQAEHDMLVAKNRVEGIKQKLRKEQEHEKF
jgi:hypothetical protein